MLKKVTGLTRPAQACQDTPLRSQGRSERPNVILPSLLVYISL